VPQAIKLLAAVGRQGKWVLPLGLLAALALPKIASAMQVAIGPLLAVLLVISFLQLNETDQSDNRRPFWSVEIKRTLLLLLGIQLVLPIVALLVMRGLSVPVGWQVPITLVGAASVITNTCATYYCFSGPCIVTVAFIPCHAD